MKFNLLSIRIVSLIIIIFAVIDTSSPADDINQWVNRTSIIARIQSGIAFQSGLMNGKILADEVIAELLNFGPQSLSQVAALKKDSLDALTNMLMDPQLDPSSDTSEKKIVQLDRIREHSTRLGNGGRLSLNLQMFPAVQQLLSDTEPLSNLRETVKNGTSEFNFVKEKLTEERIANTFLEGLFAISEQIKNHTKSVEDMRNTLLAPKEIQMVLETLTPLNTMAQLIDYRKSIPSGNLSADSLLKSHDELMKLVAISKSVSSDCDVISNLITSRTRPHKYNRKFTIGLPDGVSDVKQMAGDLYDSWTAKMFRSAESLDRLKNGLSPLISMYPKLDDVDTKLQAISTDQMFLSIEQVAQLQKSIEKAESTPEEVSEVVASFDACFSAATHSVAPDINDPVRELVEKAKQLPKIIEMVQATAQEVIDIFTSFQTEYAEELKLLEEYISLDSKSAAKVISDKVLPMLAPPEKMAKLLLPFENSQKILNNLFDSMKIVEDVVDGEKFVDAFANDGNVKEEIKLYGCLQKSNGKTEKVAAAFEVTQSIRTFPKEHLENFKIAASTAIGVSKDLEGLKQLPGSLKTNSDVKTLNGMEHAMDSAITIGKSAHFLRNVYTFGRMKASVDVLKAGGDFVAERIGEVADPTTKEEMENVWKQHTVGIESMEAELQNVRAVEETVKPAEALTLDQYGELLPNLKVVKSVDLNAEEELSVVEKLMQLSNNATEMEELAKLKVELDKFAVLDLLFSSYHTDVVAAPLAFSSLFDFIFVKSSAGWTRFFPMWVMIGILCLLIAALIPVGVLAYYEYIYPRIKKTTEETALKWIVDQMFMSNEAAENYHRGMLTAMTQKTKINEAAALAYLPKSRMRDEKILCNPATAVSVKKANGKMVPMHANRYSTRNGLEFIATQAPMDGTEPGKEDTREDFVEMIVQQESDFVIKLCQDEEGNAKCPKYVPPVLQSITIGRFTLTTTMLMQEEDIRLQDDIVAHKVLIVDNLHQYPDRLITHVFINCWPEDFMPDSPYTAFFVYEMIRNSRKPIVVHCMFGVGRTVVFIALHYVSAEVIHRSAVTVKDGMMKIRQTRWNGIQNWFQLYWIQVSTGYFVMKDFGLKNDEFVLLFEMFYKLWIKREDEEDAEKMKDPVFRAKQKADLEAEIKRYEAARKAAGEITASLALRIVKETHPSFLEEMKEGQEEERKRIEKLRKEKQEREAREKAKAAAKAEAESSTE